jgi:hypothetical protein
MGRPSRMLDSLRTAVEQRVWREFASDIFEAAAPPLPRKELERCGSDGIDSK